MISQSDIYDRKMTHETMKDAKQLTQVADKEIDSTKHHVCPNCAGCRVEFRIQYSYCATCGLILHEYEINSEDGDVALSIEATDLYSEPERLPKPPPCFTGKGTEYEEGHDGYY